MAKQSIVSISTQDDLCNWEFINQFDVESDEDGGDYDVRSVESILSLSSSSDNDEGEKEDCTNEGSIANDRVGDVVVAECARVSDLGKIQSDLRNHVNHKDVDVDVDLIRLKSNIHDYDVRRREFVNEDDEEDEDEDEDEDDEYDVDDELVPWEVKDRFVRQRIRKSGKISCGRTARLKKSALVFTRPGCVRGKHGLGLKVY